MSVECVDVNRFLGACHMIQTNIYHYIYSCWVYSIGFRRWFLSFCPRLNLIVFIWPNTWTWQEPAPSIWCTILSIIMAIACDLWLMIGVQFRFSCHWFKLLHLFVSTSGCVSCSLSTLSVIPANDDDTEIYIANDAKRYDTKLIEQREMFRALLLSLLDNSSRCCTL